MIDITNVSIGYRGKEVVHDINTSIADEFTIILGLNGCGKSTLIKSLAGLHKEYTGRITYDKKDIKNIGSNERAKLISYMPQVRHVPNIDVFQYVLHGRYPYISRQHRFSKEDYEKVLNLLEDLNIYNLRNKKIKSLSGGERQKVYLALALVQDTKYILLDEPSTFLDIRYQFEFMDMLKELTSGGKKIIMVHHDIQMALRYADSIILLKDGMNIYSGEAKDAVESGILQNTFGIRMRKVRADDSSFMYIVIDEVR